MELRSKTVNVPKPIDYHHLMGISLPRTRNRCRVYKCVATHLRYVIQVTTSAQNM